MTERKAADAGTNGSNLLKERKWQCEVQGKQQRISHKASNSIRPSQSIIEDFAVLAGP